MTATGATSAHPLGTAKWATPYFSWTIFGVAMMALVASQSLSGSAMVNAWVLWTLIVVGFALVFVAHWIRRRSVQTQIQRALWASSVVGTITLVGLFSLILGVWSVPQSWPLVGMGVVAAAVLWLAPIAIDRWVSSPGK